MVLGSSTSGKSEVPLISELTKENPQKEMRFALHIYLFDINSGKEFIRFSFLLVIMSIINQVPSTNKALLKASIYLKSYGINIDRSTTFHMQMCV